MIGFKHQLLRPVLGVALTCCIFSALPSPASASEALVSNALVTKTAVGHEPAYLWMIAPLDGEIVSTFPVPIIGRTNSGRLVVVHADSDEEFIGYADDGGWFSVAVDLWPGMNDLLALSLVEGDRQAPVLDAELLVILQPSALR